MEVQVASPVPPPSQDPFNDAQWSIMAAIADTVVPSFTPFKSDALLQHPLRREIYDTTFQTVEALASLEGQKDIVAAYLDERPSTQPEFREQLCRAFGDYTDEQSRKSLLSLLSILSTRAGALFLTGYATPMNQLPVQTREYILQSWAGSVIPTLRQLHRLMTVLTRVYWSRTSPTLSKVLSYPFTPLHGTPPNTVFPFEFIQVPSATGPEIIETDVVIVGSGCGGAVASKVLAEAGLKVLVTDKSYYWAPKHLPMKEGDAAIHLFGNGGSWQSDDTSITVINGSAWGGGGTINWSACLQTQGAVRREWSHKFGLHHFTSSEYQADLDAVFERMGAGTEHIPHNKGNRVLLEGARKLGWSVKPVAQNTGGEAHNCGYCTLGCGSCGKKGPTESWLPDAAKAGAKFMEGFEATEVLFAEAKQDGDRVAIGVKGVWTSRDTVGGVAGSDRFKREVIIKARRTILSAGPLSTPLILQKSGVKNKHLGRHLHLHPVSVVAAVWDEEVRPWEGPILSSVVNEFHNLDGAGYGPKLEATTMLPGWFLVFFPWKDGRQWKEMVPKFKKMTGYISLTRDRYGGKVYADAIDGRTRIAYSPSTHDKAHILEGIIRLSEILYVEGAREILTAIPGIEPFVRLLENPSTNDEAFKAWIATIRKQGFPSASVTFASAHQMGTARMGISPSQGVSDPKGKVWGTQGLNICDTSVFPSASGVNPMITVMGISRGIARGIVEEENRILGTTPARTKL